MSAPRLRAWSRWLAAGELIHYHTPTRCAAISQKQTQELQSKTTSTVSIASLACGCEASHSQRTSLSQNNETSANPMNQKKPFVNDANPPSEGPNTMELPRLVIMRNETERVKCLSSSPADSEYENLSSWPSRRASGQHQREATDSVLSLLTPTTKARASQLREVNLASDEVETTTVHPKEAPPRYPGGEAAPAYPSLAKTVMIMISLYVSIFLVALDRTILGPAIPSITDQFNSIQDIGWYSSTYLLTSCGFILLFGRLYTFFPTKPVFLSGIFLFEIGSAICGAAQNSIMLIVGRAIAGLGSSGVFTGAILIMLNTVPLHKRPMLQGLFGACFGVASVTGPLLGGAFTQSGLTWRWCFYINIPLGGITIAVVTFLLKMKENKPPIKGWKDTVKRMDPIGTILFLPSITCLLLALEWGAAEYEWSSPQIITMLTIFAVLFTVFVIWQYVTRNTTATIPARILSQRSIACGCASQFCVGAAMLTVSIYMPLWFQAIKGVSPFQSGANSLPLVLSTVVASIVSGGLIQRIGYYTPFLILGSCCLAVGSGLLTTLTVHIENVKWVGYLIVFGVGIGCSMQHANLAVQVILQRKDIPIGTAILSLCQTLGGAVFTAVGQNLYIDKFSAKLERIEGINVGRILHSGATELTQGVASDLRDSVLEAYNQALTQGTFLAVLFVACLAVPAALGMEWRSVKKNSQRLKRPDMPDMEMGINQKRNSARSTSLQRRASRKDAIKLDDQSPISPPAPAWRRMYRSSGHFSQWMTAKVNPDLRSELRSER